MTSKDRPLLVLGDFNFCHLEGPNATKSYFKENNFEQIIHQPTHIGGHLLDHAYLKNISGALKYSAELQSKYYTDHKGLALTLKR